MTIHRRSAQAALLLVLLVSLKAFPQSLAIKESEATALVAEALRPPRGVPEQPIDLYSYRLTVTSEAFDKTAAPIDRTVMVYQVAPAQAGFAARTLLLVNGASPTAADLKRHEKQEKRRRQEVRKRGHDPEYEYLLRRDFLDAYDFSLKETALSEGRLYYVFSYAPTKRKVKPRSDVAKDLRKLAGTLWIHADDHTLHREEVTLIGSIKVGMGLLGKADKAHGFMQYVMLGRHRVPRTLAMDLTMRVLFMHLRVRVQHDYSDFQMRATP